MTESIKFSYNERRPVIRKSKRNKVDERSM
jgi:hypothetical protein